MIQVTSDLIKQIADEMEIGCRCYIDKRTNQPLFLPDVDISEVDDPDLLEEFKGFKKNKRFYIEIERPQSRDSFEIMADFVEQINDNDSLKNELTNALDRSKPFQHFRYIIDSSGPYRDQWFEFRTQQMKEWVEVQLKNI